MGTLQLLKLEQEEANELVHVVISIPRDRQSDRGKEKEMRRRSIGASLRT
ncbi:hypothetical protein C1H46_044870 [Malus baccata]|uniref:Uncharacterized protein n=1 Tax=Malus baccata TaxID=106549 RepID=A0A540K5V9_MALBA|nr:hypothetical protein C1H46_044870 [Malus baccata]